MQGWRTLLQRAPRHLWTARRLSAPTMTCLSAASFVVLDVQYEYIRDNYASIGNLKAPRTRMDDKKNEDPSREELSTVDVGMQLWMACSEGDLEKVKFLIQQRGANPDARGPYGVTPPPPPPPLHIAAREGWLDLTEYLLEEAHATPDTPDDDEVRPLDVAIHLDNLPLAELLVRHGADPTGGSQDDYTPLHRAARSGSASIVNFLLCFPEVEVNASDGHGNSPLYFAMLRNDIETIQLLLNHGADVSLALRNYSGTSPYQRPVVSLLKQAQHRRQRAEAIMRLHGWRTLVAIAFDALDEKPHGKCAANVRDKLTMIGDEMHQTDLSFVQERKQGDVSKEVDLLSHKSKVEEKLLNICQAMDLEWNNEKYIMQKAPDVFLSHTGQHDFSCAFTEFLGEAVERDHSRTSFLDSRLKSGRRWEQDIEYCVTNCQVFVCIISKPYFRRFWCMKEVDLALKSGRRIVVVCHSATVPDMDTDTKGVLSETIENHLEHPDDELLERYSNNLRVLKSIQGIHNDLRSKHSQIAFRDKVAAEINRVIEGLSSDHQHAHN